MNRNSNAHFAKIPQVDIKRSVFNRDHSIKFSCNFGDLIPFECSEVLAGDSVNISTSKVFRLSTPLDPVMDECFCDIMYFFVPQRIVWSHTKQFYGEKEGSPYTPQTQYTIPQITSPSGGWEVGTLADYFGVPPLVEFDSDHSINALPFRAYAAIYNHFFIAEDLMQEASYNLDDTTVAGSNGTDYVTDIALGGYPAKACKLHDFFTSCLRTPSGTEDVLIPLGNNAPVFCGPDFDSTITVPSYSLHFKTVTDYSYTSDKMSNLCLVDDPTNSRFITRVGTPTSSSTTESSPYPCNLWTDLTQASSSTISNLRQAITLQQYYEKLNRSGSRFSEYLRSFFGVTPSDQSLSDPEYLGGSRCRVKFYSAVQTSGTESASQNGVTTPLGHVGAYSVTSDVSNDVQKSFTEPGFLIGLLCLRYSHSYQNGLDPMWSRKDVFDFYNPQFNGLSDEPVYNRQIFAQGTDTDNEVFGYQEYASSYRYQPSRVCAEMRSVANKSLDIWHLADDYDSLPSLGDSWIQEDKSNVDRVLAVSSSVSHQVFGDIFVNAKWTRPMPVYNIPGLTRI